MQDKNEYKAYQYIFLLDKINESQLLKMTFS